MTINVVFRDPAKPVFYTTALFQTTDGKRHRQDGCRRVAPGRREDKERQRSERDIDDGDRIGELANAKDRESLDLNVETAEHGASGDSKDRKAGTRRGTASTGEPQTRATTAAG